MATMTHASERAHPRSRGENTDEQSARAGDAGSSPLTRGKRSSAAPNATPPTAHPRSRGENPADAANKPEGAGSSPLTRGKPARVRGRDRSTGLIPAHAGKTASAFGELAGGGAHPRSRGENLSARSCAKPKRGSSPLTRGKRKSSVRDSAEQGLIPAHAGKTFKD